MQRFIAVCAVVLAVLGLAACASSSTRVATARRGAPDAPAGATPPARPAPTAERSPVPATLPVVYVLDAAG